MSDIAKKQKMRDLVVAGKAAQRRLAGCSRKQVENIFACMLEKCRRNSDRLARLSAGETGKGNLQSKLARHHFVLENIASAARDVKAEGIIAHYPQRKLYEIAVPLGLIVAVVPCYAPVSTTMTKALLAILGKNAILFVAPPNAHRSVRETVKILQIAAKDAGAPDGCISCANETDALSMAELMSQREVDFILATSTDKVALAAHRSGKPNISVGESNTPVYIDNTAGIVHATRCILSSQEFDFAMACGAEEVLCVHALVYQETLAEFKKQGAYLASEDEIAQISSLLELKSVAGKPAREIARMAGFNVPPDTPALLLPFEKFTKGPFFRPKFAPLLPLLKVRDWEGACVVCSRTLSEAGTGHSVIAHTTDQNIIMEFVAQMPAARILINAPGAQGAMGMATGLDPSLTLGAGTKGRCISTDNISLAHFFQRKRVTTLLESSPLWQKNLHELDIDVPTDISCSLPVKIEPSPWIINPSPPLPGKKFSARTKQERPDSRLPGIFSGKTKNSAPWSSSNPPPPALDVRNRSWPRKK